MQKCLDLNISLAIFHTKTIFICTDVELRIMFYYRDLLVTCKTEKVI